MVKRKVFLKRIIALLTVLAVLALCGCTDPGRGRGPDSEEESAPEESGSSETEEEKEDETTKKMYGPQVPPEGQPYDEWKKIEYSSETGFDVTTFCVLKMYDGSLASESGYTLDPEEIPGHLEIVDVKVNPVGGEMKLRSGGYVDITVTTMFTGEFRIVHDDSYYSLLSSFTYHDNSFNPFDAYTGTSLFNYRSEGGGEGIHEGEATDSGMIESDVTWNGRIYRIFARSDSRNAGSSDYREETQGGNTITEVTTNVETVYTFRIPADYDGLALMLDRDEFDEREYELDNTGEILASEDRYADILTDDRGDVHEPDEYCFIKVTDLLEKFTEKNGSGA